MSRTRSRAAIVVGVLASTVVVGCCDARLRGVVSDETTGAPIAGALVQSGAVEVRTDELGFFDLDGLSCDDCWRVAVSAPGYNLLSTSVVTRPGEDPARLVRDLALVPLARPEAQPDRSRDTNAPPPVEDYRPRYASIVPGDGPDRRLYIKLTEDQTQVLMRHMQTHGSEEFARALRALIESLPQK